MIISTIMLHNSSCNCNIILFLTTLILSAFYLYLFTPPNLQVTPATHLNLRLTSLFRHKKTYFDLSPSPAPAPAPAPAHHVHLHSHSPPLHRRSHHYISPSERSDDGGRKKVLVAVLVSAGGATSVICLVALFLGCRKNKSSSKNVKRVISDRVSHHFYLESLDPPPQPPPFCSLKQDSDGIHQRLSNSEILVTSTGAVAAIESVKFDEEDEQVFFGSPTGEEVTHHSSDDESFHSFCNSHHSSNPRISDASIGCDTLEPPISTPPPPPPPPPRPFPCSSSSAPFSSPRNSATSSGSNQTPVPPPPPPFLKGNPPPPSQAIPMGKDGSPLPKLKPLHWDKVRAAPNRSMVWDKLRSSSFEFDEEMIESLFGYNLHNSNEEAKSKSPSPSKHVLEPKRLQNLTILLKALNTTPEQVCHALIQGNGLNLQQLEVLTKMEPTKEEEAKLTGYKGDLGSAETFVVSLLTIPYAFSRIEAMLYRETFEDEVAHLRKTFSMLEEACKELRSSRLFLKLLEAVLKTGNRMNVGTIRGGAKAFKLDALLKLADVKGTDGKTTLLHFVVQEIIRSEGIRVSESIIGKINQKSNREEDCRSMGLELVAGLTTELCNVKKTASIDFDVIAGSVSNVSECMGRLRRLVNEDLVTESSGFVESMKWFLKDAEKQLEELEGEEQKVLEVVKEITEYFHGNMSKDDGNPLRIFVIVRDFLGMLDVVCRELRRSKGFSHPNPLAPFQ